MDALIQVVMSALEKGDDISFSAFGSFYVVERGTREGRNPPTGQTIQIQASKVVTGEMGLHLDL